MTNDEIAEMLGDLVGVRHQLLEEIYLQTVLLDQANETIMALRSLLDRIGEIRAMQQFGP